jgi:hypothetical protein
MCSIGARGLWMEMLCVMHEAVPRGSLVINGRALAPRQIASLAACAVDDVAGYLSELEDAGVFSRDGEGTIYSRRMQRDVEKEAKDKANGGKGGNPALKGVNPPDKSVVKAQIPEARDQKESTEASASVLVGFDDFWSAFPKRNGNSSRKNAESRYRSAIKAGISPSLILDGAKRYAAHCLATGKSGSSFVKTAEAWLNGRYWESVYGEEPRAGPAPRRTYGQIVREAVNEIAGHDDDQQPDRQADFSGPTLDLVAGSGGADIVDLYSRRANGLTW